MVEPVGHVVELWRYPVKSMAGSRVEAVRWDARGVHADRLWAVRDLADRRTTGARRVPALLHCSARYAEEPGPLAGPGHPVPVLVTLPDGEELPGGDPALDARLSALCDRDVALVPLPPRGETAGHRGGLLSATAIRRELGLADDEPLPDAAALPLRTLATVARWSTPPGTFADLAPVHVLTTQALRAVGEALGRDPCDRTATQDETEAGAEHGDGTVSVRRFRPSVLVDLADRADQGEPADPGEPAYPERAWVGGHVRLGPEVALEVTMPTVRCVVPTRAQPGLEVRPRVGRALVEVGDRFLGVYADVSSPGLVRVGDEVHVTPRRTGPARSALDRVRAGVLRAGGRLLG